jgi:Rrf2 family nitric oxide-sensitive transcriptional repressor
MLAMHLTLQTDYALRTLLFLGSHPNEHVSAGAIAKAYGISAHHVAKIAKLLVREGWVDAKRGQQGGLRLAPGAGGVTVGEVVRRMEPSLALLECFDAETNTCPLRGVCKLERSLHEAQRAFLAVLDAITLSQLLGNAPQLATLLQLGPKPVTSARRRSAG